LLVVVGLMVALAVIAVAFVPRMAERQNTWRGSDRLQGWLVIARQWAKKDQVATGIRLQLGMNLPNTATPNPAWVTDLQYIQQPADYFVQPWSFASTPPLIRQLQVMLNPATGTNNMAVLESPPGAPAVVPCDFSGGYGMIQTSPGPPPVFAPTLLPSGLSSYTVWPIQAGDYLEIGGGGLVHQISTSASSFFTNTNGNYIKAPPSPIYDCDTFFLTNGLSQTVPLTKNYRIIRGPRIVAGEQGLQLPQDVAIDLSLSRLPATYSTFSPSYVDILFSPTGPVVGSGAVTDKIILFVRDVTKTGLQGDLTLLTINCRSGLIAAQPVDMTTSTTGTTAVVPSAAAVSLTVASTAGIGAGTYVILDPTGPNPETQLVTGVPSATTITLQQANYPHTAPFTVIINPFTFALSPQTSGM
jgi:hypothetical protein